MYIYFGSDRSSRNVCTRASIFLCNFLSKTKNKRAMNFGSYSRSVNGKCTLFCFWQLHKMANSALWRQLLAEYHDYDDGKLSISIKTSSQKLDAHHEMLTCCLPVSNWPMVVMCQIEHCTVHLFRTLQCALYIRTKRPTTRH